MLLLIPGRNDGRCKCDIGMVCVISSTGPRTDPSFAVVLVAAVEAVAVAAASQATVAESQTSTDWPCSVVLPQRSACRVVQLVQD